jgi:prepilin signal peptidase PulO-like enzyme (type II secretory pathway)
MKYLLLSGIGLTIIFLGIQDFRERKISVYLLLLTLILCATYFSIFNSLSDLPKRFLINSAFTSIILVSGALLVKLKRPNLAIVSCIGAGDFLFLLAISPMFSFEAYLVFLNTSIVLILGIYSISLLANKQDRNFQIPFAGALAICLLILLFINEFISVDLTNLSLNQLTF